MKESSKNMKDCVEGDWKTFTFRQAFPDDYDGIVDLLWNHYITFDPFSQLVEADQEFRNDMAKLVAGILPSEDNLSFVAVDKASGRYAAARVSFVHEKNLDWTKFDLKSSKLAKLFKCFRICDDQSQIFERYNIDKYAELVFAVTHEDFRKQGLCTEMYRRSIALIRAEGFFLAKVFFSSPYSRAAGTSVGFTEVGRVRVMDVKDDNGEAIAPGATENHLVTQSIYVLQ